MRKALISVQLLLTAAISIYIVFGAGPTLVHRRDYDRAYMAWKDAPTPANEARLQEEAAANRRFKLTMDVAVTLTIFLVINLLLGILFFGLRKLVTLGERDQRRVG